MATAKSKWGCGGVLVACLLGMLLAAMLPIHDDELEEVRAFYAAKNWLTGAAIGAALGAVVVLIRDRARFSLRRVGELVLVIAILALAWKCYARAERVYAPIAEERAVVKEFVEVFKGMKSASPELGERLDAVLESKAANAKATAPEPTLIHHSDCSSIQTSHLERPTDVEPALQP